MCSAARSPARRSSPPPARSTSRRPVHSLHAYFLRPGDPTRPILYEVDRLATGAASRPGASSRSSTARRSSTCRRASTATSRDRITSCTMPTGHARPGVPSRLERAAGAVPRAARRPVRPAPADRPALHRRRPDEPQGHVGRGQQVWLRADGKLPDDPVLHACIVTYASDMTLLDTAMMPFGLAGTRRG